MARLEEVCEILDSKRVPITAKDRVAGPYPYYGANGVQDYVADYIFDDELVLLAEDGGHFGSADKPIAYRVSGKCWVNNHAHVLKAKECIEVDYLCYSLMFRDVSDIVNGATRQKLTQADMRKIKIPLLPIEKQKAVVAKIGKVFELIALRKEQLEKLDELVKSRFIELFGDQKANPFGWPQTTIGDCCTLKSGTSLPADKENEGGRIPYVKVGDMNYPGNEQYITTSSRFVTEQTAGAGIFPVGTVIFPKRGGAIGTNKKRLTTLPICADLNVMGVTAGNALKSQYLMAYFNMVDLGALDNGSSVPQINNKDIAPLVICLPPLALQEQFAAFVEQTDKSKLAVQQGLQELEILKKSLMQQYFG